MGGWRDRFRILGGRPAVAEPQREERVVSWLSPEEVAALGALPPEGVIGHLRGDRVSPEAFVPNAVFSAFLQDALRRIGPTLASLRREAEQQRGGWLYLFDGRVEPFLRVDPDAAVPTEDILGGFEVIEGCIAEGRYWANPGHALVGARGLCVIPGAFRPAMLEALRG